MKAKKVMALALAAVMLICASVAATVAYLKDDDSVVNTFTVGKVHINLDEADVKPDGTLETDNRVKENDYHLLPGITYIKDPTVTVLKDSDECYVRTFVTFTYSSQLDTILPNANLTEIFNGYDENNWKLAGVVENTDADPVKCTRTYEFRYVGEAYKGTKAGTVMKTTSNIKLAPLFDSFKVPEGLTNEQLASLVTVNAETGEITSKMTITVTAHAIQAAGFTDAADAWSHWS